MLIYVIRFASWCSWGVLYPFLAVWLLRLGVLDEGTVGLVVGAAVIANRVGALLFAPIVDRVDKRVVIVATQVAVIVLAVTLHAVGRAAPTSVAPWLIAAALFGLANSVATLAQITFIANQFPAAESTRAFSYENVALNVGAGVAPLLSSVAISVSLGGYALAPIPFAALTATLALFLPKDCARIDEPAGRAAGADPDRRTLPVFLAMNFLTLLAYAQFYGVFPAHAESDLGAAQIGWLFAFSSAVIVVSQVPLTRVTARFGERALVAAANLATAAGTAMLTLAGTGLGYALTAVLLLTLGEMVYGPLYQTIAVRMVPRRPAYAMGALTFVWGVAESLASVIGLVLIGVGLGVVSFLTAAGACVAVAAIATVAPGLGSRSPHLTQAPRT